MKLLLLGIFAALSFFAFTSSVVYAQTTTPSPTSVPAAPSTGFAK